nr:VIT1/CCC1 transporter family protein [Devosia naphthalenivorans]
MSGTNLACLKSTAPIRSRHQAALASGVTFSVAAALPLIASVLAPSGMIIPVVVVTTLVCLAGFGGSLALRRAVHPNCDQPHVCCSGEQPQWLSLQ